MPNKYTDFKPFLLAEMRVRACTYQQNIDILKRKKAPVKSGLSNYFKILILTRISCFCLM